VGLIGLLLSVFAILSSSSAQLPPAAGDLDESAARLARERYDVAEKGYEYAMAAHRPGESLGTDALEWLYRRAKARLDVVEGRAEKIGFLKQYVEQLRAEEEFQQRLEKAHLAGPQAVLRARYQRLEGELWTARVRER
jgi:hypothetical protein